MKLLFIILFIYTNAHSETQVFEAVAKYEGETAYIERHSVTYEEDVIIKSSVEYLDKNGKNIGSLRSDFTHSLAAPNYIFKDLRYRRLHGLQWRKGKVEVFSKDRRDKQISKKVLHPGVDLLISGPGLIYCVANNMNKIIKDKGIEFKYAIPGRLDAYKFFIKPLAHNTKEAEFEVRMQSWPMRIFSPRIRIIYDVLKKRVKFYEGPSNLRNANGVMMAVDVVYMYQDQKT